MLEKLEATLRSALEGAARLLPGKLHPLELAAQLRAAMDSSQVISTETGYVANRYRVLLHPEDFEPLAELAADIEAQLAHHLQEYAGQQGYGGSPRITVKITSDCEVARGSAKVTSTFDRSLLPAELAMVGGLPAQVFEVTKAAEIGRSAQCPIHLPEPSVSRHHARLEWTYQGWLLRDLGSSNGSYVNGERRSEQLLSDDDLIQLGDIQLRFNFRVE